MSDYSEAAEALICKTRAREDALELRDETCRSRFLLQSAPTAKVILFFHGFTATPQQFVPIGKAFFKAGYNVLIPLLPGHGQAGDWNDDYPPPLPETPLLYQEFGLNWLKSAQTLGEGVVLGGLSGGSTLAAWMTLERPQAIDRSLLFAPYLSNSNPVVDWFVEQFNIYFEWKTAPGAVSFGYEGFSMPALRVFLDMGEEVLDRAKTQPAAPMLIVSSESDQAVGLKDHQILFESALNSQPKCWYHCFDRRFEIKHNMMTKAEGNEYRDWVITIAKVYVESDLTWQEVEQIRQQLTQRDVPLQEACRHLEEIVVQAKLNGRISPDFCQVIPILFG